MGKPELAVIAGGRKPHKGKAFSRERKPPPQLSNTSYCSGLSDLQVFLVERRVVKQRRRFGEGRTISVGGHTLERKKSRRASADCSE